MDQPAEQEQYLDSSDRPDGKDDLSFLVETVVVTTDSKPQNTTNETAELLVENSEFTLDDATEVTVSCSAVDVSPTSSKEPNPSKLVAASHKTRLANGDGSTLLDDEEKLSLVDFVVPRIAQVSCTDRAVKDQVWSEISDLMSARYGGSYNADWLRDKWGYMKSDAPRINQRIHLRDPRPDEDIHPTLSAVYAAILSKIPDKFLSQKWRSDIRQPSSSQNVLKSCSVLLSNMSPKPGGNAASGEVLRAAKYRVKKSDGTWEVLTREELDARQKKTGAQLKILTPNQMPIKRKTSESSKGVAEAPPEKKPLRERLKESRIFNPASDSPTTGLNQTPALHSTSSVVLSRERNRLLSQQNQYLRDISESLSMIAASLSGKDQ